MRYFKDGFPLDLKLKDTEFAVMSCEKCGVWRVVDDETDPYEIEEKYYENGVFDDMYHWYTCRCGEEFGIKQ